MSEQDEYGRKTFGFHPSVAIGRDVSTNMNVLRGVDVVIEYSEATGEVVGLHVRHAGPGPSHDVAEALNRLEARMAEPYLPDDKTVAIKQPPHNPAVGTVF